MRRMTRASAACRRLMTIPWCRPIDRARFCRRDRRSLPHPPLARRRRLSGAGSKALSVGRGRLRRRNFEVRGPKGADFAVRSRQCDVSSATRASSNSRTGPSRSPGDQRCVRRASLSLAASRSSCTRCCETGQPMADCDFNQAALHPAYPIKRRTSAQRTQASQGVETRRKLPP